MMKKESIINIMKYLIKINNNSTNINNNSNTTTLIMVFQILKLIIMAFKIKYTMKMHSL